VAVDALANFNRDRQEDAVHARAEGPEREHVERELGEVLPVGLIARSSWRLGRLWVKSRKGVQSVFVRVVSPSLRRLHASILLLNLLYVARMRPGSAKPSERPSEKVAQISFSLGRAIRHRSRPSTHGFLRRRRRHRRRVPTTASVESTHRNHHQSETAVLDRSHASRWRRPSPRLSRESSRPRSTGDPRAHRVDHAPRRHRVTARVPTRAGSRDA